MNQDLETILFTEEQLKERIKQLGAQITKDYEGKKVFLIGILRGCFVFMADLARAIDLPCVLDFMAVSSYGNKAKSSGAVKITKDLNSDIEGYDVIVVEDILDSGVTLNYLVKYLAGRNPASVKICTLLDKPEGRKAPINADYVGFEVPKAFIVGYGLDYAEKYRNLPYIGILKPEIYM